jgi:DNA adenine methylase
MDDTFVNAMVPYFGAKRILAEFIVSQMGPHHCYWEVMCGSMAALMAKPKVTAETVNDLYGDLVNLAHVIQHPKQGPWLYRRLRRQLVHEELYWEAANRLHVQGKFPDWTVAGLPDDDNDPNGSSKALRAADFFTASWLGRNGLIGTEKLGDSFCVRYTANGGIQGTRWRSAVNSLPAWRRRLANVTILRRDCFELLERIEDTVGTVIYCDPPYIEKGATYIHDFTPEQHILLAKALRRFKNARVLVSYYDHPQLEELYPTAAWATPRWNKIICHVTAALGNQGNRAKEGKKKIAPEVLLINGPRLDREENESLF